LVGRGERGADPVAVDGLLDSLREAGAMKQAAVLADRADRARGRDGTGRRARRAMGWKDLDDVAGASGPI